MCRRPCATGAFIFSIKTKRFLFGLRNAEAGDAGGYWGLFGGKVDAGENILDALFREIEEETKYSGTCLDCYPVHKNELDNFDYYSWLVIVEDEFEPDLNDEHLEWKWSDIENFPDPLHPGILETLDFLDT